MSHSLPSEQEYLLNAVLKRHEANRPAAKNRVHGDHVEDVSDWRGKETADPSAGTGEGSPCEPPKPELI